MKLSALYQIFLDCQLVTTDSRNCPEGSLFIALKGESFNGNAFAGKALETGCAYAVIDESEYAIEGDQRYILVDDCLQTLQQLANYHRRQLGTRVIGITGTNGKTTTKELISAVLSQSHNILYTLGNLNNHIGVPSTLLRLKTEHDLAVIEMGANHPGEIKFLSEIAEPDCGIITNVGKAHLEGFGSFEGVIRTKGELYDYIRRSKGKIFIKKENEYLQSIAKGIEQITYGNGDDAFASGQVVSCDPFLVFNWKQQGKLHTVETHMIGSYNLDNVLAAVAVGRFFKIPAERISRAIAAYEPTNNRSQFKKTDNNELIIDAYNANPSSMKVALDNFITMPVQPKAIILGDMRELGPTSDELHAEVVEQIKKGQFDKVFLCGEHFSKVGKEFSPFATTEAMVEELRKQPLKGYHILIKGSHSMGLEKLADIL
mgnify:CR=1 FL=1